MKIDSIQQLQVVNSFGDLPAQFYTRLATQPLTRPHLLHVNTDVADLLGLSAQALTRPEFLDVCAGTVPLAGGQTLSAVYSGHQFGVWAGQLGDGRAHLLGEVVGPAGQWELQLKGSGRTPYSRMGDGRAVLRSSVREYLAAEAMAGLGIPTTRALALVVSEDPVYRETVETAAVLCRVSPSFVRFGSFEHWWKNPENCRALLDYVVAKFYPECLIAGPGETNTPTDIALRFVRAVVVKTKPYRRLANRRFLPWCDEHGQYVDSGLDAGLWSLWLYRRSPSRSSAETVAALIAQEVRRIRPRLSGSRSKTLGILCSRNSKKLASSMTPYLMTSASPARYSRSGRVMRAAGSINTMRG